MKIIALLITVLTSQMLFGQSRNALTVTFKSGQETIEGILILPDAKGKVPAVVFQQGSGKHSFDGYEKEAWGPHKFYIEDVLLEQGYAVLYCNKRGLGNSSGNWKHNDFYGRADDAYAAVEYLKTRPDIDSSKIGISGHSQGGWIAQIAAAQHEDIAFVIALAGPTVGVKEQTDMYESLMYQCNGYTGAKLEKKMKKDRKHKNFGAGIGKIFPFIGGARHWYLIHDYNNDEVITNIKCPTLFLFAEYDVNVPPDQNIEHFNQLFGDHPPANFTIKVMPGGQHGFYQVRDRCVDWATAEAQNSFDSDFQELIREWVVNLN
jgi:dipeptidyl aminopeptidase/acylaminoacyl peptidase